MSTPSPEQKADKRTKWPYNVLLTGRGALAKWRVEGPGIDPMDGYWHSQEHAQDQANVLNRAFQAGSAHVQAQAAPLAQGLVDAGNAMRDELQKKVVLDRLTNDKFPGSAECVISRWTQAKASTLPVADGEKERSGPSVKEIMAEANECLIDNFKNVVDMEMFRERLTKLLSPER